MRNLRNLRHRPPAPAKGAGRVQKAIRRAFMMEGIDVLSGTEIYNYTHALRRMDRARLPSGVYDRTRRTLRTMCEPICKAPPYGAWLWRLLK
jgi:hypothetical protein